MVTLYFLLLKVLMPKSSLYWCKTLENVEWQHFGKTNKFNSPLQSIRLRLWSVVLEWQTYTFYIQEKRKKEEDKVATNNSFYIL